MNNKLQNYGRACCFQEKYNNTPGRKLGDCMREVHPGTWCGKTDVTVQPDWNALNSVECQLWENDGSGKGIRTTNSVHKIICST